MPPTPPSGPPPPLTKRKRQALERRAERRTEIMELAAELFDSRGYFETSVGDIAEAAGLSKPTIYHYFSSKEEILYAIHDSFTARLLEEHEATRARTSDPLEQLHALFASFFGVIQERRAQVRAFFSFFDQLQGEYRAAIVERRQLLSETVESIVREAIAAGELREADPRLVMLVVTSVFNWAPRWFRPSGPKTALELADFVYDLFLDGLRPR